MLADHDAAILDQRIRRRAFARNIEPRIGELNLHAHIRNDGFNAEVERGIARDNFGIFISADIADFPVAIAILVEGGVQFSSIG